MRTIDKLDHYEYTGEVRLLDLAPQINDNHRAFLDGASRSLRSACRVGQLLLEAKELVPHGQWQSWVDQHCEFELRNAQRYMRLAKYSAEIPDALTQDEALRLLTEILNPKTTDLSLMTDPPSVLVLVSPQIPQQPNLPDVPFFFPSVVSDWLRLLQTMPAAHKERSRSALIGLRDYLNAYFASEEAQ